MPAVIRLKRTGALKKPAHRIVVGHSCGTSDHAYHEKIARGGSYLGFDRFGLDIIHPDAERVKSLLHLLQAGHVPMGDDDSDTR